MHLSPQTRLISSPAPPPTQLPLQGLSASIHSLPQVWKLRLFHSLSSRNSAPHKKNPSEHSPMQGWVLERQSLPHCPVTLELVGEQVSQQG